MCCLPLAVCRCWRCRRSCRRIRSCDRSVEKGSTACAQTCRIKLKNIFIFFAKNFFFVCCYQTSFDLKKMAVNVLPFSPFSHCIFLTLFYSIYSFFPFGSYFLCNFVGVCLICHPFFLFLFVKVKASYVPFTFQQQDSNHNR